MSSWREGLVETGAQGIISKLTEFNIESDDAVPMQLFYARAVLDAILPQITDPAELYQLPQWSIVVFPVMGTGPSGISLQVMTWDGARLQGDLRIDEIPQIPEKVISMYGPLAVLWRPDA